MFSIQPLAGQPDTPQTTPTATPPVASVAPQQSANPYRLGQQAGGKRVVYGGVATPTSQSAPPTSLPPPPLSTTDYTQGQAQVGVNALPPQHEVGVAQTLRHHWFYLRPNERYWIPFSLVDSAHLEQAWTSAAGNPALQVLVPTDGGRYDVDLHARSRSAIYWSEPSSQVRRCSWFFKGDSDRWYMPYSEDVAVRLEEEYMGAVSRGVWGGKVEVGEGEAVVMHSQSSMAHYPSSQFQPIAHEVDYSHPRSVLRGFAEIDHVEQGEQSRIDHLVFVVHGIGEHHDLSFRCLVDCVDDFREVSQLMLRTHRFAGQAAQEGDTEAVWSSFLSTGTLPCTATASEWTPSFRDSPSRASVASGTSPTQLSLTSSSSPVLSTSRPSLTRWQVR
ncbi:SEC23-interacting protein [Geodia barretti]|uniref:SEC23-interacting protein n=1 Tax=Geodia barretti TaxID=519541 RepID=A0AA35W1A2_GEOBA|nr:SEC23-interacting protein [Geodia barretti]